MIARSKPEPRKLSGRVDVTNSTVIPGCSARTRANAGAANSEPNPSGAATRTVPVEGVALLLGVDRFMSEARAITNLIGNGVATLVVSRSEGAFDDAKRALAESGQVATT